MSTEVQNPVGITERLVVRLAVPTVLLVGALLGVVCLLVWYSYRADIEVSDRVPTEIVVHVSEEILHFFEIQQLNLSLASKSIPGAVISDEEKFFLSEISEKDSSILELAVFHTNRTQLFRVNNSTAGKILEENSEVIIESHERVLLSRQSDITAPLTSLYNTTYVVWTFPVFDITGKELAGVLSAVIDISTFWQYIVEATPNDLDSHVYIVDPDGKILVSNKTLPDRDYSAKARDILFSVGGTDSVQRYYGLFNTRVVGRTQQLPPTDWSIVAEVPVSVLMASTERNIAIVGGILSLIAFLAVYAFYAFQRNLTRPLRMLSSGVNELGAGNYKMRIKLEVANELSLLATVMNAMAANIDARTSDIVLRLKRTISDLDRSAKALMKRDEELSKANDRLLKLDHAKSEFVSIAAHQLRTPLSALKWAQQMLVDGEAGPVVEAQKTLLVQSQESVRRMVTLVNDLLSADHLEYGKVTYNFTPVDSEAILTASLSEMRPMATERGIIINTLVSPTNGIINADPERLKEVFLNILSNAIKYTPNNGTVTVRTVYGMGKVVYTFSDTGIGIPEADRDRLFEKFVRMDNAKKVDANGSGLGLFIAKKIIDAQGGRIWFDSVEGRGTTFFVELPATENKK